MLVLAVLELAMSARMSSNSDALASASECWDQRYAPTCLIFRLMFLSQGRSLNLELRISSAGWPVSTRDLLIAPSTSDREVSSGSCNNAKGERPEAPGDGVPEPGGGRVPRSFWPTVRSVC